MNATGTRARQLLRTISAMSDADRQTMADRMPQVMNPKGHFLTINNTLLLCQQAQRTDLTVVAGFKQWIKAGRVVRKGQKALGLIAVPIQIRQRDQNGDKTDTTKLRFRFVPVFDVSQTEELSTPSSECLEDSHTSSTGSTG